MIWNKIWETNKRVFLFDNRYSKIKCVCLFIAKDNWNGVYLYYILYLDYNKLINFCIFSRCLISLQFIKVICSFKLCLLKKKSNIVFVSNININSASSN